MTLCTLLLPNETSYLFDFKGQLHHYGLVEINPTNKICDTPDKVTDIERVI